MGQHKNPDELRTLTRSLGSLRELVIEHEVRLNEHHVRIDSLKELVEGLIVDVTGLKIRVDGVVNALLGPDTEE